jgi:DNA-binding FadR family transcriptional regulator
MQTSRTPVIAALKALTEQGLVRYATNRGYWVREFSIEEVLEAYDTRAEMLMREHVYESGQVLKAYWPEILHKARNHEHNATAIEEGKRP